MTLLFPGEGTARLFRLLTGVRWRGVWARWMRSAGGGDDGRGGAVLGGLKFAGKLGGGGSFGGGGSIIVGGRVRSTRGDPAGAEGTLGRLASSFADAGSGRVRAVLNLERAITAWKDGPSVCGGCGCAACVGEGEGEPVTAAAAATAGVTNWNCCCCGPTRNSEGAGGTHSSGCVPISAISGFGGSTWIPAVVY